MSMNTTTCTTEANTMNQTTENKTQLRGHCPCCGREQAVTKGRMSKHGYTVDNGWFNGVCSGHYHAPMEHSRKQTEAVVASITTEVANLEAYVAALEAGTKTPSFVADPPHAYKAPMVEWAKASDWAKSEGLSRAKSDAKYRARMGREFAKYLETILNTVHGRPLMAVTLEAGPAPVLPGERRNYYSETKNQTFTRTVTRVQGARVWWKSTSGSESWTGIAAWRKLPMA